MDNHIAFEVKLTYLLFVFETGEYSHIFVVIIMDYSFTNKTVIFIICNRMKSVFERYIIVWLLRVFVLLENSSLVWRRNNYRWMAAKKWPNSALMTIEQWGFFSVSHHLWHGPSVNYGHLGRPVTHLLLRVGQECEA